MKLEPTYDKYGEQRAYYMGEDGNEYFVYKDERTNYTVREMNKDDIKKWYDAMRTEDQRLTPIEKAINMARVSQQVEKMIGDSFEKTLLILNPKDEIIGQLDFTEDTREPGKAEVQIYLKDEKTLQLKGTKTIELMQRMNICEKYYDEIWTESTNHEKMRII